MQLCKHPNYCWAFWVASAGSKKRQIEFGLQISGFYCALVLDNWPFRDFAKMTAPPKILKIDLKKRVWRRKPENSTFLLQIDGFCSCLEFMFGDFGCRPRCPFLRSKLGTSFLASKMSIYIRGKPRKRCHFVNPQKPLSPPSSPTKIQKKSCDGDYSKNHIFWPKSSDSIRV